MLQVATVMAASTATLRYPSYMNNDWASIMAALIPIPKCHFITPGYLPFTSESVEQAKSVRKTTVLDVMRRLLQPKSHLVSVSPSKRSCYISLMHIIQGDVDPFDVRRALTCRSTRACCASGSGSCASSSHGGQRACRCQSAGDLRMCHVRTG
jgi:hypothetical protein